MIRCLLEYKESIISWVLNPFLRNSSVFFRVMENNLIGTSGREIIYLSSVPYRNIEYFLKLPAAKNSLSPSATYSNASTGPSVKKSFSAFNLNLSSNKLFLVPL